MNNWQEWVCYTCPTNPLMNLHLISVVPVGANVVVRWASDARVKYFLERSTNPASPFALLATNLPASMSDTTV